MGNKKLKLKAEASSGFGSNVLKLVTGKAFSQVLAIMVMPVLTRLYAPADYGVFQLFISVTAVVIVISALRYEMTIVLPEKEEDASTLVALSTVIVFTVSAISLIIVIFLRDNIAVWLKTPELATFLWYAPLVILSGGLLHVFSYWSTRRKQFGRVAVSSVSTSVSASAAKLTVGYLVKASPAGLIGGQIFGNIMGTVVLVIGSLSRDWKLFKRCSR